MLSNSSFPHIAPEMPAGNYHNCHYKKIILLHDSLLNGSFHTELVLHVLVQIFHHSIQILQIGLVVILQSVTGMLCYEIPVIYAVLFQCGDQRLGCGKGLHLVVCAVAEDRGHRILRDPAVSRDRLDRFQIGTGCDILRGSVPDRTLR